MFIFCSAVTCSGVFLHLLLLNIVTVFNSITAEQKHKNNIFLYVLEEVILSYLTIILVKP